MVKKPNRTVFVANLPSDTSEINLNNSNLIIGARHEMYRDVKEFNPMYFHFKQQGYYIYK